MSGEQASSLLSEQVLEVVYFAYVHNDTIVSLTIVDCLHKASCVLSCKTIIKLSLTVLTNYLVVLEGM